MLKCDKFTRGPNSIISYLLCISCENMEIVTSQIDTNCEYAISVQVVYWCVITLPSQSGRLPVKYAQIEITTCPPNLLAPRCQNGFRQFLYSLVGIMMNLWQDLDTWWYDGLVANWKFFKSIGIERESLICVLRCDTHVILYVTHHIETYQLSACFIWRTIKDDGNL